MDVFDVLRAGRGRMSMWWRLVDALLTIPGILSVAHLLVRYPALWFVLVLLNSILSTLALGALRLMFDSDLPEDDDDSGEDE